MASAYTSGLSAASGDQGIAEDTETTEFLANVPKEAKGLQLSDQHNEQVSSYEWKSWTLRRAWTPVFLILDIAIITGILTLDKISRSRNGIADVTPASSTSLSDFSVSRALSEAGLLWTALPSFLMALYRLIWESIVSAAASRQPYVELRKSKKQARGAGCSIMLDYQSYSSF